MLVNRQWRLGYCALHFSVARSASPRPEGPCSRKIRSRGRRWDTVQDKLYSFCSNASGALAPDALAALGKSKMMIHGMEEGAALPPVWLNSEAKVGLAAAQLRAVNPSQLQLYTVQIVRIPHTARAPRSLLSLSPSASLRCPEFKTGTPELSEIIGELVSRF
eukprot:SAG31_NODE_3830_length_3842_cov_2.970345_4_plen_162_part_00